MFKLPIDIYNVNKDESGIGCGRSLFVDHKWIPIFSGKKVLDIGFGNGELLEYLYQQGNEIYGTEIAEASIIFALDKRSLRNKGELIKLDICSDSLPWSENFFDIIFATECMEHFDNPIHAILEIKRTLKDGGEFYVSIPEFEDKFGFHGGKHSYIYPGLFQREAIRWFFTMTYFTISRYREHGGTAQYHLINRKTGGPFIDPFTVVKGNVYVLDIYSWLGNQKWLNTWKEIERKEKEHIKTQDFSKSKIEIVNGLNDFVSVGGHLLSKDFFKFISGRR